MKTYQIGNKVTCIVRSYCPSIIGQVQTKYNNEPYTILKDVNVSLSFTEVEKNATSGNKLRQLHYNSSGLNQVRISNIHLTNKILNMLFESYDQGTKTHFESVIAQDNKLYLSTQENTIYQVFVYDENENMIKAVGTLEVIEGAITLPETTLEEESAYLVVYQTLGNNSVRLSGPNNTYFTLDLICEGNTDEETAPTYIHIQKAGLRADKSLYFSKAINAVDLTFNVIETEDDYIVLD